MIGLAVIAGVCVLIVVAALISSSRCSHKWEVLRSVSATDYELQCVHCGDIKRRRV